MKPRRTVRSTGVLALPGGNEDNDLWYESLPAERDGTGHVFQSVWELSEEERKAIAAGMNIALLVWGAGHPPVALEITSVKLGKPAKETS